MKKIPLFFLCTIVMTQPVMAGSNDPSDWASESVQLVTDLGLLDMTRVMDFHQPISRETYAYLIYQLYEHLSGGPIINGIPISKTGMVNDNRFTDTDDLTIRALKSAGLINGYPDGSFRPDQPISREEIMSLYVRLLEKLGYDLTPSEEIFADEALISPWAKESVKKCYASSLIQGVGENKVAPKGQATVEESLVAQKAPKTGLSLVEVKKRVAKFGRNELPEAGLEFFQVFHLRSGSRIRCEIANSFPLPSRA